MRYHFLLQCDKCKHIRHYVVTLQGFTDDYIDGTYGQFGSVPCPSVTHIGGPCANRQNIWQILRIDAESLRPQTIHIDVP